MKLNRTGSNWNRLERDKINENWDIIEGSYNDVVGQITDEVVGHLIDSARLDWKEPVDTVDDLPANAEVGETRMVREADPDGISYVYRYDGEKWEKIQAIDVTLVNEVDRRLSRQIEDIAINAKVFGMLGNAEFNNASPLKSALESGAKKLLITEGIYNVNSNVSVTLNGDLEIITTGNVKINYVGEDNGIGLRINTNGYNLTINYAEFDGNDLTRNPLSIVNDSVTYSSNIYLNNVMSVNAFSTTYGSIACGIHVKGRFDDVIFDKIVVDKVSRGIGVGIPYTAGCNGIAIIRDQEASAKRVIVNNPRISNIINNEVHGSENDLDCDGIYVNSPQEGEVYINGGIFKDCKGRSIKTQTKETSINGTKFIRNKVQAINAAREISCLIGSSKITNITFDYTETGTPLISSNFGFFDFDAKDAKFIEIDGVYTNLKLLNSTINPYVSLIRSSNGKVVPKFCMRNINMLGINTRSAVRVVNASLESLEINGFNADRVITSLIDIENESDTINSIYVNDNHNRDSRVVSIINRHLDFSGINNKGFMGYDSIANGAIKSETVTLSVGESYLFSKRGSTRNISIYFLSTTWSNGSQGIFSVASSTINPLATGSSIEYSSDGTDPNIDNKINVWATDEGVYIKNMSTATRSFTLASIGA